MILQRHIHKSNSRMTQQKQWIFPWESPRCASTVHKIIRVTDYNLGAIRTSHGRTYVNFQIISFNGIASQWKMVALLSFSSTLPNEVNQDPQGGYEEDPTYRNEDDDGHGEDGGGTVSGCHRDNATRCRTVRLAFYRVRLKLK